MPRLKASTSLLGGGGAGLGASLAAGQSPGRGREAWQEGSWVRGQCSRKPRPGGTRRDTGGFRMQAPALSPHDAHGPITQGNAPRWTQLGHHWVLTRGAGWASWALKRWGQSPSRLQDITRWFTGAHYPPW